MTIPTPICPWPHHANEPEAPASEPQSSAPEPGAVEPAQHPEEQ